VQKGEGWGTGGERRSLCRHVRRVHVCAARTCQDDVSLVACGWKSRSGALLAFYTVVCQARALSLLHCMACAGAVHCILPDNYAARKTLKGLMPPALVQKLHSPAVHEGGLQGPHAMRMRTSNSSEGCELPRQEDRRCSLLNAASYILLASRLRQTAERPPSERATQWRL